MKLFTSIRIYICTIAHLKIHQFLNYLFFYLKKYLLSRFILGIRSKYTCEANPVLQTLVPKPYLKNSHNPAELSFCFLNEKFSFDEIIDWNREDLSKLWLYNLHYFDFLNASEKQNSHENFNQLKYIVSDWIKSNPIGYKNGWEPYPISLRVNNWIFFYVNNLHHFNRDYNFKSEFLNSLYQQCGYLYHFIEYHLGANHLFKNGKALFIGGIFFSKKEWIEKGRKIIESEIKEQILADGGHFERSPMYHSIIVEDILDLINFISASNESKVHLEISELYRVSESMLDWLNEICHPDNNFPLFGDSAFGLALTKERLIEYFNHLSGAAYTYTKRHDNECVSLRDSGYYIFRSSDQFFVIDGGELGVNYQPGHAHCDLFSFEYSYNGERFIVDTGPGEYLNTELRKNARSIYGHNCVVVNGLEQAELWKVFRMGRRIHPSAASIINENEDSVFRGSYRNNLSRRYAYHHHRIIRFVGGKFFHIEDRIKGNKIEKIESLIHFHPECDITECENCLKIARNDDFIYIILPSEKLRIRIEDWFYVPEFGKIVKSRKLIIEPHFSGNNGLSYIVSSEKWYEQSLKYMKDISKKFIN